MIDKTVIDPNALHYYRMLKEAGFSAYFVGGSVRDLLLGKEPKDFDIATNATPQQIKRVIPQGRIIGRRFRHVMLERNGGRYEIVTFRGPVLQAEEAAAEFEEQAQENTEGGAEEVVAQPQERARRHPDLNQFGNAEQDALRRDFTINALFYDPDSDELVDYVEGKLDVDRRIVRTIGEPMARMEEDPIRILRAIRHKMKLGLEYDPALEAAMREKAPLLEQTSKDRIREEFLKVCNDQSLVSFLVESKRLGLTPYIMPWFNELPEELWESGVKLWEKFQESPAPERANPDLGLALMMVPLIPSLVLEPYKQTLSENEKNYLPDMKYFLSCETLRNFYLRNLRVSRAQTDYIIRALFYYSRMTGLWLEQGPPRRVIGRLFQHPPAVLAAKMSRLKLQLDGAETPAWMTDLAEYDNNRRGGRQRHHEHAERGEGDESAPGSESGEGREPREGRSERHDRGEREGRDRGRDRDRGERGGRDRDRGERGEREHEAEETPRQPKQMRLPPPDQPMVWNGPLHAPVLRPTFEQEQTNRWARKNQTVRAFRPSGIPNQPTDYALLKSNLVYNYKPEIDPSQQRGEEEEGGNRGTGRGRRDRDGRRRGRDRDRGDRNDRGGDRQRGGGRGEHQQSASDENSRPPEEMDADPQPGNTATFDEDSIGNIRRPGERPAALGEYSTNHGNYEDGDEDPDDNIGNRLDAPPTSGHVGVNGEGYIPPQSQRSGRGGGGGRHGGGGGGGGGGRRRGRRRGRRGGGGGGGNNRNFNRGSHNNA